MISLAQVCNGAPPCQTDGLQIEAFTSGGGSSIIKVFAQSYEPQYTTLHKLTIATDRRSFIDMYVDNALVYSNTTMPVDMDTSILDLNLYQFTTVNNETDSTTWSNLTVYGSSGITVEGLLPQSSTVIVNGTNGFGAFASASNSGTAVVNVSLEP